MARNLGIKDNLLTRWKRELEGHVQAALIGTRMARDEELARLKRELARVKGHQWFDELMSGSSKTVKQIAQREGVTDRYVSRMLPLAFLSPEIVTSIVNGTQPIDLSAISLTQRTEFDADWMMQREALGF